MNTAPMITRMTDDVVFRTPGAQRSLSFHLLHGSTDDQSVFQHHPRGPGAVATVGASVGCDWTVRAAGVPPVAFAIREDRGVVSIRPSPEAKVLLDGKPEAVRWIALTPGCRIDIGLLRIEVREADMLEEGEGQRVTLQDLPRISRLSLPNVPCVLGKQKRGVPVRWSVLTALAVLGVAYVFLLSLLE